MNRFGGFGGGNMQAMMRQAQKLQQDAMRAKEELENSTFEGTASGGLVKVEINGKFEMTKITIDKNVVDPDDVEMLEDLVLSAIREALSKAEDASTKQMSKITGGMNMPGLF